jgi:hypothetical protein
MPLKFPDILEHNNSNFALVDSTELRGTSYPLNILTDTGSVPSDKRKEGAIVFITSSQEFYGFIGTSSAGWDTPSNWIEIATSQDTFPFTGSAQITGSLGVTGSSSFTENISVDTVTIGRRSSDVIVVGQDAGLRYSGSTSVFVGDYAGPGADNVLGTLNTAIGYASMYNTSGSLYDNYAIGGQALKYLKGEGARGALQTEAGYNTAIGSYAFLYTEYAQYNTAIGYGAAYQLNHGEIGTYPKVVKANTIIGDRSAFNMLSGSQNTMIGSRVAFDFIRGSNNTFIGRQAGDGLLSGSRNTIVGYNIGPDTNSDISDEINDNIIFGGGSYINYRYDGSDTTIYGIGSTSANIGLQVKNSADTSMFVVRNDGNVGIGTSSPSQKLEVQGSQVKFISTTSGENRFMFSMGDDGNSSAFYMYNSQQSNTILLNSGGNSYFNGGNVGIGITSPSYKLDVSGSGNFTDDITVTGSITIDSPTANGIGLQIVSGSAIIDTGSLPTSDPGISGQLFVTRSDARGTNFDGRLMMLISEGPAFTPTPTVTSSLVNSVITTGTPETGSNLSVIAVRDDTTKGTTSFYFSLDNELYWIAQVENP